MADLGSICREDATALSTVGTGRFDGSTECSRGNAVENRSGIIESIRPLPIRQSCRYTPKVAMGAASSLERSRGPNFEPGNCVPATELGGTGETGPAIGASPPGQKQ